MCYFSEFQQKCNTYVREFENMMVWGPRNVKCFSVKLFKIFYVVLLQESDVERKRFLPIRSFIVVMHLSTEEKIKCLPSDIACIEKCNKFGNCSCPPGTAMAPDGKTCAGEFNLVSVNFLTRFMRMHFVK